jgi:hypothetical protein
MFDNNKTIYNIRKKEDRLDLFNITYFFWFLENKFDNQSELYDEYNTKKNRMIDRLRSRSFLFSSSLC